MFKRLLLFLDAFNRMVDALEKANALMERKLTLAQFDKGAQIAQETKNTSAVEELFNPPPSQPGK